MVPHIEICQIRSTQNVVVRIDERSFIIQKHARVLEGCSCDLGGSQAAIFFLIILDKFFGEVIWLVLANFKAWQEDIFGDEIFSEVGLRSIDITAKRFNVIHLSSVVQIDLRKLRKDRIQQHLTQNHTSQQHEKLEWFSRFIDASALRQQSPRHPEVENLCFLAFRVRILIMVNKYLALLQ